VTAFFNQRILRQTEFDSASPDGTAMVVHQFEADGPHELSLFHDDAVVDRVAVVVGEAEPAAASVGARPAAAALDLTALAREGSAALERVPVPSGGYVAITGSRPLPDHHVVVRRVGETRTEDDVFDSRRLGPRSMFAVTLVRPGRYSLENTIAKTKAEIVVTYPKVSEAPYRPPGPLEIQATKEGFGAASLVLSPAQGLIIRFDTESHIRIELSEPDDGPHAAT
jgi:hypothetical protein